MENLDKLIGQNLAKFRGDISQSDLAESMRERGFKWSQATVWTVEKGERPMRLVEAHALTSILGIGGITGAGSFLSSTPEMHLLDALDRVQRENKVYEEAMASYLDALDNLAVVADTIAHEGGSESVHGMRWGAVASWLEDGSPHELALRAEQKRALVDGGPEAESEMIDRGVRTFRELIEARDAEAREQGFDDNESLWSRNLRTIGNYSGMQEVIRPEGPDNGVDQETS